MKKYKVIYEEKLTVRRKYVIQAENEDALVKIMDKMDNAGFEVSPSEFVPQGALIECTDEVDYRNPDKIEYEYVDHYELEGK